MNITIIGTGYVGLVSGICLAEIGHNILFIDKVDEKIAHLSQGHTPIYEPGLEELLIKNQSKIHFTTNLQDNIDHSDVIFICVGTPQDSNGSCDLSYIKSCIEEIKIYAKKDTILVIKSTVPVGTSNILKTILHDSKVKFSLVSNPEFLREGSAIFDFMNPDRIVVGSDCNSSKNVMRDIYQNFIIKSVPYIETNISTAEMIKHASNSFLAVKLSFMNELAWLTEATGADIYDLEKGMGSDSRIGNKYLRVGPGYGGSCLPKDTIALVKNAEDYGVDLSLIKSTIASNNQQFDKVTRKILTLLDDRQIDHSKASVTILGLAFKDNTDDFRESPAIHLIDKLSTSFSNINCYDPQAKPLLNKAKIHFDPYQACKNADIIIIATEWQEFINLDWQNIFSHVQNNLIYDLRNILDIQHMRAIGFCYHALGQRS